MAVSVAIVFAVRFIVLVVVGDQVVQREAIVNGNKIDTGPRRFALMLIQIRTAGKTIGKLRQDTVVSLPIAADTVSVFPVPFRPRHRKLANHVTTFAEVPGFRDEFHLRKNRILYKDIEKTGIRVDQETLSAKGT